MRLPAAAGEQIRFERVWGSDDVDGEFYASPVCHEGILYCVSNEGVLYALDARTGGMLYHQKLPIPSGSGKAGGPPAEPVCQCHAGRQVPRGE